MFTGLLSEYRRISWVDPSWLGNYRETVNKGLHSLLHGLAAEVAVKMGFHTFIEKKWKLKIGKNVKHLAFDLTLKARNKPIIVVEIDTIDMVGYAWDDRYVPKYVKLNSQVFKGKLIKPLLLKILAEQHPDVGEIFHLIVLAEQVTEPPPWRKLNSRNLYLGYLNSYLSESRDSLKPYSLVVLNEKRTELYVNGNRVSQECW